MASTHAEKFEDALPRLITAHPLLFEGRPFEISSYLPCGWYTIVDELCRDIESILGAEVRRFQAIQSKEKGGAWRLYWRLEATPEEAAATDRAEAFDLDLASPDDPELKRLASDNVQVTPTTLGYRLSLLPAGALRRSVYERVRSAEHKTELTCMWCGAPGSFWTTGWVHVACAPHRRPGAMTLEQWRANVERRRSERERGRQEGGDGDE